MPRLQAPIITGVPAVRRRRNRAGAVPSRPGKIVGRYLAPFLAAHAGAILEPPARPAVSVEADFSSLVDAKYEKLPG